MEFPLDLSNVEFLQVLFFVTLKKVKVVKVVLKLLQKYRYKEIKLLSK